MKETTTAEAISEVPETPTIGFPYDISFADSETSPATVERIETYLAKLSQRYDRITDCRVIVRIPHNHGPKLFHVHIQLDVPGKRLAVGRDNEPDDSHSEIQTAIKDAFQKITRQLDDFTKIRKEHKAH